MALASLLTEIFCNAHVGQYDLTSWYVFAYKVFQAQFLPSFLIAILDLLPLYPIYLKL